ncbi:GATA zinc finger domain-containing protein 14-like [Diprion similis]|uniref:GATA zinc finger domain-containing protein 14-like n=1 Tax=Diprion similis TaxID=362088 RepID=UPI001EF8130B|nr:GATA zinc finger domain-containing protein 14-like [Diprion similis]
MITEPDQLNSDSYFNMNTIHGNISNDFEPRELPKQAPRFDSPPVPSVPEVSLIFDKSHDVKAFEYNARRSPSMDKYDSYATWKQTTLVSTASNPDHNTQKSRHSAGSPLERCHSQSDAHQLHKNLVTNNSLRHSRSDPSLIKQIDALSTVQGYNKDALQSCRTYSPTGNHISNNHTNNHGNFENNLKHVEGERQYFDRQRQHNIPNSPYKNDNQHSLRHVNPNMRSQHHNPGPKYMNCDPKMQKLGVDPYAKSPNRLQTDLPHPGLQNSNFHTGTSMNQNFHPNMFARFHQVPPYCDSEYGYPYPHPYSPNYHGSRNENEETVKNLLQLITNQSEQIKSLQSQVERLLKIQEESLKDREKCNCARNIGLVNKSYEQNAQLSIQTTNNNPVYSPGNTLPLTRDDSIVPQRHNGTMERNMIGSTNVKESKKQSASDYNDQNNDGRLNQITRDEQLKNKILEQKVSIGVMTSFEFTVQNNPFASDGEDHRQYYGRTQTEIDTECSAGGNQGLPEHGDMSRACQNVFSRVSNLPLENIIEDTESHLSLSQQPSSNFHSSPTIDEFKSLESANRKMTKNVPVRKTPESNTRLFDNENPEFAANSHRENHFSNQQKQHQDMQEQLKNTQPLQSSKNFEHTSIKQNPCTDNFLKQCYPVVRSSGSLDRHRRNSNDQNFSPQTAEKNISSLPHRSATNAVKHQHDLPIYNSSTQQEESNSPYRFEDQNKNKKVAGLHSPDNYFESEGFSAQTHGPRLPQPPTAYNNERNKVLSRAKMSQENGIEESIVLNSGELQINEQPPPSPEPSIHVEMQEYSSDEESDKHGGEIGIDKQTPKVGWTFYNNVLGQVNQILQNTPITRNLKEKPVDKENGVDDLRKKATVESVKVATMEQLRQLGISFADNNDLADVNDTTNKKVTFDSSYYPRLEYRGNMTQATSTMSETDTSMHMNALALKYLSDEQLGELALQKHSAETLKHLMVSNVQGTNMSFATMRYLERYQLLPTNSNPQVDDQRRMIDKPKNEVLRNPERPSPSSQMPRTSCPSKILDISTLKQQPKLL